MANDPRTHGTAQLSAIPSPPQSVPVAKQLTSHDAAEIVSIFKELKAAQPEAQQTTIRAFSSTLFMQLSMADGEAGVDSQLKSDASCLMPRLPIRC